MAAPAPDPNPTVPSVTTIAHSSAPDEGETPDSPPSCVLTQAKPHSSPPACDQAAPFLRHGKYPITKTLVSMNVALVPSLLPLLDYELFQSSGFVQAPPPGPQHMPAQPGIDSPQVTQVIMWKQHLLNCHCTIPITLTQQVTVWSHYLSSTKGTNTLRLWRWEPH